MTFTTEQFALDLLNTIGAPASPSNVAFIERWANLEGGHWHNTATFNPLNTSLPEPGSVNFQTGQPGGGVQAYPDVATGEAASAATLLEPQYATVVQSLRQSDTSAAAQALVQSPWDAGHYNYDPTVFGGTPVSESGAPLGAVPVELTASTSAAGDSTSTKTAPKILRAIDNALNPDFGLGDIVDPTKGVTKTARFVITRSAVIGGGLILLTAGVLVLVQSLGQPVTKIASVVPSPVQPAAAAIDTVAETATKATAIEAKATEIQKGE